MQSLCQLQQNQNEHQKNKCGHNLVSVAHNMSDHHIHRQQQWLPTDVISSQQYV